MTAASPAKRAKPAKRLRRFFRGISAAVSLPLICVDSTSEAVERPPGLARKPVCARGNIPHRIARPLPRRNSHLHLSKSSRWNTPVLGYNGYLHLCPILEISGEDAGTDFTDVDGCDVRPQAKAEGAEALPVRPDAGAAVPLQSGMRGMRQNPVSRTHFKNGLEPGRMLQGRGRVRHADGFDSRWRAADAPGDRQDRRWIGRAEEVH